MAEGDDVSEHLANFFDSVDKLGDMDVNINPYLLTILLLYSLPASFELFQCAIESRHELPAQKNLPALLWPTKMADGAITKEAAKGRREKHATGS
mgnify:FL=1